MDEQPPVTLPDIDRAWDGGTLPGRWNEVTGSVDPTTVLTLLWLSRLSRAFDLAIEARVREHGLIATELRLLIAMLFAGSPTSPTRLNETVLVSPGGVTKAIDRLEHLRLVTRRRNPHDRRGVLVALTKKGERVTDAVLHDLLTALDTQLGALTRAERTQNVDALRRLLATYPQASMPR